MAQNIMSFFGYETYFMTGDVNVDGQNEGHAYNVVADAKGQKYILDYSITSAIERNGQLWSIPNMAKIDNYDSFIDGERQKTFTWRHIIQPDGKVEHRRVQSFDYGITK